MEYFGKSSQCFSGLNLEVEDKFRTPEDSTAYIEKCYGSEKWSSLETQSSTLEPISEKTRKMIEKLKAKDQELNRNDIVDEPLFEEDEQTAMKQPLNKVRMFRQEKSKEKAPAKPPLPKIDSSKQAPIEKTQGNDKKKELKLNVLKPGIGGGLLINQKPPDESANAFFLPSPSSGSSNNSGPWLSGVDPSWNSYSCGKVVGNIPAKFSNISHSSWLHSASKL